MSTTATGNTTAKPMTAQFQWDDPLLFSEMLRDDEKLVLHSARSFCSDRLMPRVLEAHRHEKFDRAIFLHDNKVESQTPYPGSSRSQPTM